MSEQEIKEMIEVLRDYAEVEEKFKGLFPVALKPVTAKIKSILKKL